IRKNKYNHSLRGVCGMTVVTTVHQTISEQVEAAKQGLNLDVADFSSKVNRLITAEQSEDEKTDILIKTALEQIDEANPDWTYFTRRTYTHQLYRHATANRGYHTEEKYSSFHKLIELLVEEGIYTPVLLEKYKL